MLRDRCPVVSGATTSVVVLVRRDALDQGEHVTRVARLEILECDMLQWGFRAVGPSGHDVIFQTDHSSLRQSGVIQSGRELEELPAIFVSVLPSLRRETTEHIAAATLSHWSG